MSRDETERPDWLDDTPMESTYGMLMWDSDGDSVQEIELSRAEYIALKGCLAKFRGLAPKAEPAEEDGEGESENNGLLTLPDGQEIVVDAVHLDSVVACVAALNRIGDSIAPAEAFLSYLLLCFNNGPVTPAQVEKYFEEFRGNFETMVNTGKYAQDRYSNLLATPQ